jgi:NAD(P)-dependent dehydrogenase (short-subunit alcohol dehydrogenase family)
MSHTYSLKGKHIVILGGSSGLGLATAQAAAAEGARLTIVSSNQDRVDSALATLPEGSKGAVVDATSEAAIKVFFEQTGKFDHLVYTAGESLLMGALKDTELEDAQKFFVIRFWGAVAAVKYAAPHINPLGSIVLTGGTASIRPAAGWSMGVSVLSALDGFMRAMAIELAPVRVNMVTPGVIKTNLWSNMSEADREGMYTHFGNILPVKRLGEAEDVAHTYLYLMRQTYSTGQSVVIDGGTVLL